MIALGTKLGPQQGADQMQGIIGRLQGAASNIFGGGAAGGILAGGMAGGLAGAMVGLAQGAAQNFQEAFELHLSAMLEARRFQAYFGKLAPLATEWTKALSESTQYVEHDIGALMGQIYSMGRGLGMTAGEAAKLAQQVSQLSLDFAAFQGLSPEEAFHVLQAAIAGHARALTQYGIVFSQTEKEMLENLKKTGDEAAYTAKMIELLGEKMGAMRGAASKDDTFKQMREYQKAVHELKEDLGGVGEFFVKAAIGWKYIIEAHAKIAPVMLAYRAFKDWMAGGDNSDAEAKAAANRARADLAWQTGNEEEARAKAAAAAEEKLKWQIAYLEGLDTERAAEIFNAGTIETAKEKIRAHDAEELRNKLKKGEFDELERARLQKLLELDDKRREKAQKLAEEREREKQHLSEQFGMLSALERAQAKDVLRKIQGGGVEAFMGLGEKGRQLAMRFDPELVKQLAQQVTEREGMAGIIGAGMQKVNVSNVLKAEISAKLQLDGPNLAQQFLEKLWPQIMDYVNNALATISGGICLAQAGALTVEGAAAQ
jgi:hypothetical protein